LFVDWLVLEVEPFFPLVLDGLRHLDVEVLRVATNGDNGAADIVDGTLRRVASDQEDVSPKAPVRVNAQEAFAQGNEAHNV
jgi:hypothetical protein